MNDRRALLCFGNWKIMLLSSVLLLQVIPLFAHDTSMLVNVSLSNSSSLSTSKAEGLRAAPLGGAVPPAVSSRHVRREREVEEAGSGTRAEAATPSRVATEIDADSAEGENPIGVVLGASLPTWAGPRPRGLAQMDFIEEDEEAPRWQSEILQPDGTLLDVNARRARTPPPADASASQPEDVFTVGFYDPAPHQHHDNLPPPRAQELQGGDPTSWTLSDFYDYLSPDYSTTEVFPDEDQQTPVDMDDENVATKATGSNPRAFVPDDGASGGVTDGCPMGYRRSNGTCQSLCKLFSGYCFNGGQCYLVEEIGALCRCNVQDYVWNKGSRCESAITEFQVMCIIVGVTSAMLLLLFMLLVFFAKRLHLLKSENRRLRRRSKYRPQSEQQNDNFSLSTIAEGSQANKTMNRYTWEYKPKTEPDVEDDPAKLEEPVKSPPKDDESLNIENSLTPKHENNIACAEDNGDEGGVTIDLELLLPKEAKMHPDTSPPLQYNVFLYKLPKSPKKSPVLRDPPGRSHREGGTLSQVCPRRSSEPGYSPVSTHSLPPMPTRSSNPRLGKACTP